MFGLGSTETNKSLFSMGLYFKHRFCNQPVAGSSPISSSKEFKDLGLNLSPFFLPQYTQPNHLR